MSQMSLMSKTSSPRIDSIDGMRALAATAVIFGHVYLSYFQHGLDPARWLDALSPLGGIGVTLFLILSGFCISHMYVGANPRTFQLASFVERRFVRIYPAYVVALLVAVGWLLVCNQKIDIGDFLTHLTLSHNFFPAYALSYGPYWTVALEMQLYGLFAIGMLMTKRMSPKTVLASGIVVWIAWRAVSVLMFGTKFVPETFTFTYSAFGRLLEFALGVLIAANWHRLCDIVFIKKYEVGIILGALMVILSQMVLGSKLGSTNPVNDLLMTCGLGTLFVLSIIPSTRLSALLSKRMLARLGEATYSVYLFHAVVIDIMAKNVLTRMPSNSEFIYLVMTTIVCILTGLGAYMLVERPVMSWAKVWHKRSDMRTVKSVAV